MSCNSCSRAFNLLRAEKGCPGCGFSYCSKCLKSTVFLHKLNSQAKVCVKCSQMVNSNSNIPQNVEPPDAYYKRIHKTMSKDEYKLEMNEKDGVISSKLKNLKENTMGKDKVTDKDIAERLERLKGKQPCTSDAELYTRLAKIKDAPVNLIQSKPSLPTIDLRTEQQQADDLVKQYVEQTNIDSNYEDNFDGAIKNIESRLQKLKGDSSSNCMDNGQSAGESDDEEKALKKIMEKVKHEIKLEDNEIILETLDELPFCEICNEDADVRCLGCKYLYCKQCFNEHKDDDDGCDHYETYKPTTTKTFS